MRQCNQEIYGTNNLEIELQRPKLSAISEDIYSVPRVYELLHKSVMLLEEVTNFSISAGFAFLLELHVITHVIS